MTPILLRAKYVKFCNPCPFFQQKEFVCDICSRSYCYKIGLIRHQEEKHGEGFCCEHCGKICTSQLNLQRHIQTIHQGKRYLCPICNDPFTTKSNWKRHCKNKHQLNILPDLKPIVDQKKIFTTPVDQLKKKVKESEGTTFSVKQDVEDHTEGSCKKEEVVGEVEGYEEHYLTSSFPEENSAVKTETGIMIAPEFD